MNTQNETSAAGTAELFVSTWNEHGVCTDPESIIIADMPKGTQAVIEIGTVATGTFRFGYIANTAKANNAAPCKLASASYATRAEAIGAALVEVTKYFLKDKKAIKALEAFHALLKGGELPVSRPPVSTVPDVALPADGGTLLERYRAADARVSQGAPLPKGRFVPDLAVSLITPNPENHRKTFDPVAMQELADSLKQVGQLQPIAVRRLLPEELGELPDVGTAAPAERYEIILGERRWRAFSLSGWATIEAKVYEGVTRRQAKAAALVENLQRVDVNPVEEAEGYRDLIEAEDLTQEQCAARVGRARPTVANAMRLLKLPADVIELIRAGKLTPAHGHALARFESRPLVLKAIAEIVVRDGVSAGLLEEQNRRRDIPFRHELEKSGLICVIGRWQRPRGWDSDLPAAVDGHKDYEAISDDILVCYNPEHWAKVVADEKAAIASEQAAARAKAEADAKKGKGSKIRSIEDLERGSYRELDKAAQTDMAGLIPADQVVKLPEKAAPAAPGEKVAEVVVCTVPDFADRVRTEMDKLKADDRAEVLPAVLAKARAAVRKWKKIGPRELVVLLYAGMSDERCGFSLAAGASQGVKVPAAFADKTDTYYSRFADDTAKGIRTLLDGDTIGFARVLVDDLLVRAFIDGDEWDGKNEPSAEDYDWHKLYGKTRAASLEMLRHILGVEELGLLEETKAGRKKLAERLKAQEWYAPAFEKAAAGKDIDDEDADAAGEEDAA